MDKLVKGLTCVTRIHVVKGILHSLHRVPEFFGFGMLRTPQVEHFLRGEFRAITTKLLSDKIMKSAEFIVVLRSHLSFPMFQFAGLLWPAMARRARRFSGIPSALAWIPYASVLVPKFYYKSCMKRASFLLNSSGNR